MAWSKETVAVELPDGVRRGSAREFNQQHPSGRSERPARPDDSFF
jgi:hypothetical protein